MLPVLFVYCCGGDFIYWVKENENKRISISKPLTSCIPKTTVNRKTKQINIPIYKTDQRADFSGQPLLLPPPPLPVMKSKSGPQSRSLSSRTSSQKLSGAPINRAVYGGLSTCCPLEQSGEISQDANATVRRTRDDGRVFAGRETLGTRVNRRTKIFTS